MYHTMFCYTELSIAFGAATMALINYSTQGGRCYFTVPAGFSVLYPDFFEGVLLFVCFSQGRKLLIG